MNRIWVKGSAASNDANVFLKKQASFESRSSPPATSSRLAVRTGKSSNLWLYVPHFAVPRTADDASTQYPKKIES